ncbi:insulinase family protein [Parashewanella curva]|uniref:Protease 3 n=1 Tax=Parashewanella curva TaxID=2338552 RepID=A0A3L8PZY9_9GAMM|nr:insulinase family protein [Parashewanella curva]RLV60349.1 insulinase family protein [Parashewanella curva]
MTTEPRSIITSPNDHRQYRFIRLDNELKVLLIQDDKTNRSAVSMAVNVGHFDDPSDREGMAHFLEHMLFLGTQKYPKCGEFNEFVNHYGGSNNAWTGSEHTNFFSSIAPAYFDALLDRFSQFFISPLFDAEFVDRERHAIESEFSLKLKDDVRRIFDVEKETCNPNHPFTQFSVGNLVTLGGDENELRQELLEFYHNKYSANIMTLCLISPNSLDELEALAHKFFSDIKNKFLSKNYPKTPLYDQQQLQKKISVVPVKSQRRLTISFLLPNVEEYYPSKPLTFISHLLGNETKGSLLSYLKSKGWVNNLSSGGGASGYNFKDFSILYQLTELGLEHIDDIVITTFEYLELIKQDGLENWRYQERANLLQQAFDYQEPVKAMELVSHLSINMQHYPVEDVIYGDYRMDGLNLAETNLLLAMLKPERMRLQVIAPEIQAQICSKWYKAEYRIDEVGQWLIQKCNNPHIRSELTLPEPNPFIIEKARPRLTDYPLTIPSILKDGKGFRLWYQKDQKFNVPKGHIYLAIDSLHACDTQTHAAYTRLYIEMVLDYLAEYTYDAEVAGIHYHIYPHQAGLTLHISGFTIKQLDLLKLIIEKAKERNFCQTRFQRVTKQLIRNWRNISNTRPISQLFSALTSTVQLRSYEPLKLAKEIEDATLELLHQHVERFYEATYLEGFLYGDYLQEEAEDICEHLSEVLDLVSAPSPESERELVNLKNRGTLVSKVSTEHQDSAILVYFQSEHTNTLNMALFSLLNHTMSSSFFHELRTQKQLGYMVGTNYLPLNRHPGMIFYIQSPNSGPRLLLQEIDKFIGDFAYTVMELTSEQWEKTKAGLISQIMEHDPNLKTRSQRYWTSIGNKDYQFNQREQVVNEITLLTRAELIRFLIEKMKTNHKDRIVLYSCGEEHQNQQITATQSIPEDLISFKHHSTRFSL